MINQTEAEESKEIKYKCPFNCGKNYILERNLKIHITLHNQEAFYYCEKCNKNFTSQKLLTKHKKTLHNVVNKIIECPFSNCTKKFMFLSTYNTHVLKHVSIIFIFRQERNLSNVGLVQNVFLKKEISKCMRGFIQVRGLLNAIISVVKPLLYPKEIFSTT